MMQHIRLACWLALAFVGLASPAYTQRTRPAEAQAGDEHSPQQRKATSPATFSYGEDAADLASTPSGDDKVMAAIARQLPMPPQPLRFWEDILPFLIVIFAFWLVMLILGLTLLNATAAAIFLYIAAIMAPVALVCILGIILAITQISTRTERQIKRARNPFWRFRGN
jgi:lysylphosphatidylglycerol synthetase-like protein (DUF2156 family)